MSVLSLLFKVVEWCDMLRPKIIPADTAFSETHKGPIPNGGAYSTAYFYNKEGRPCEKDKASRMNIVEYAKDGSIIKETYGII